MRVEKCENAFSLCPDTGSTKLLSSFVSSLENEWKLPRPNFDKKVFDLLYKYMYDGEMLKSEVAYLDSMHYGCMYNPAHIVAQIDKFAGAHASSFQWNRNYKKAIDDVKVKFAPTQKLKVQHFETDCEVEEALPRLDTHSGWTFIVTGNRTKGENIEGAAEELKIRIKKALIDGTLNVILLPGRRLQVSGAYDDEGRRTGKFKQKTRLVSMVDFYSILIELMFSIDTQKHFSTLNIYAGGKNPIVLHDLINKYRGEFNYWTSLDYSSYDQTIPSWLITDAFNIIRSWFQDMNELDDGVWNIMVHDFIHKTFVGKGGVTTHCHDGVPSGSMFTQIIGTLCNEIMIETYFNSKHRNDYHCLICGDDNCINTRDVLDHVELLSYLKHNFGIEGNADKCTKGNREASPIFLSRTWLWNSVWREPKVLIAKILYPERFRPYAKGEIKPELILYSYYLAYPNGLSEIMDICKFLRDFPYLKTINLLPTAKYMPGFFAYQMRFRNTRFLVS